LITPGLKESEDEEVAWDCGGILNRSCSNYWIAEAAEVTGGFADLEVCCVKNKG